MNTIEHLSIAQLKRAIVLRQRISTLQGKLSKILGEEVPTPHTGNGRRKMSAAARAKIGAAQRARWAKSKGKTVKPKRKMSAAVRAALSAAAKARWKKAKAAGKTRL